MNDPVPGGAPGRARMLTALFDLLPQAIWVWEADETGDPEAARLLLVNDAAVRLRARPDAVSEGMSPADLRPTAREMQDLERVLPLRGTSTVLDLGTTERVVEGRRVLLRRVAFALDERAVATVIEDVTQLVDAERDRTAVLDRLLDVADDERRALGDLLHDDVIQQLAGVLLELDRLGRREGTPGGDDGVGPIGTAVRRVVEHLRSLIFELSPPEVGDVGLEAALRRLAGQVMSPDGPAVEFDADVPDELDDHVAGVAYRVLAEALVNVRKHSGASTVRVSVHLRGHRLVAEVVDDGVGPGPAAAVADGAGAPEPGHLGVRSMVTRCRALGGELRISAAPDGGTSVVVDLPALERLPARDDSSVASGDWRPPGVGRAPLRRTDASPSPYRRTVDVAALVQATPDLVSCFDRDLVLRFVNPSVARRQGQVGERFVGRSALDAFPPGIGDQAQEAAATVLRTGQPFRHAFEFDDAGTTRHFDALLLPDRRAPGEPVWRVWAWVRPLLTGGPAAPVEVALPPAPADGFEDLVPPSRVADALDGSPDLVACFDESWRFVFANQASRVLMRRPTGQVIGRRPDEVGVHQRLVRPQVAERALRSGRPQQFRAAIRVDDAERHADVVLVPVGPEGDRLLWVVARPVASPPGGDIAREAGA